MVVVSDTSPLNYLVLIQEIDVLRSLHDTLRIPEAVVSELNAPEAPEAVRRWIATPPSWVEVRRVATPLEADSPRLHPGEKEAVALALHLRADLLLMDDQEGRAYARKRGLKVVGTLGILDEAAERGLIRFSEALDRLLHTSFHATPDLVEHLRKRDALRRNRGAEHRP